MCKWQSASRGSERERPWNRGERAKRMKMSAQMPRQCSLCGGEVSGKEHGAEERERKEYSIKDGNVGKCHGSVLCAEGK